MAILDKTRGREARIADGQRPRAAEPRIAPDHAGIEALPAIARRQRYVAIQSTANQRDPARNPGIGQRRGSGQARGAGPDVLKETASVAPEWPTALGKPDVVVTLPAFDVPNSGTVEYQNMRVDNPFKEDTWLKAIAVTSHERMGALPELPSVHEALPDFEYLGWIVLFAPAATPAPVIDALAAFWAQARNQPAIKSKLEGLGMYPPARYASRDAVAGLLRAEKTRTAQLVKKLGITPT